MQRRAIRLLAGVLVTLVLLDVLGLVWVFGGASPRLPFISSPPTATPTTTPAPVRPPREPGLGQLHLTQSASGSSWEATWADRSDDESGFHVRVAFSRVGRSYTFEVPANATSFAIPNTVPEPSPDWHQCDARAIFGVTVTAYNAAGDSDALPAGGITADCGTPLPNTPTPAASAAPPKDWASDGGIRYTSGVETVWWADTLSDEVGFRVRIDVPKTNESYTFAVRANTTSFVIPDGVRLGCETIQYGPSRGTYSVTVSAYNAAGESRGLRVEHSDDCPTPMPRATPASN